MAVAVAVAVAVVVVVYQLTTANRTLNFRDTARFYFRGTTVAAKYARLSKSRPRSKKSQQAEFGKRT